MDTIEKALEYQIAWHDLQADDEAAMQVAAQEALSRCAEAIAVLGENLKGPPLILQSCGFDNRVQGFQMKVETYPS